MTTPADTPQLRWGLRFSPHVIPFLLTVGIAWIPLSSAILNGMFWWWGPTYRQVEFVMEEAQANDGAPYIDGRVTGADDVTRVSGIMVAGQIAPEGAAADIFAPGRRIMIWQSPSAPDIGVADHSVNDFPVAVRPVLPGLGAFLWSLVGFLAVVVVGLWATAWVHQRYARRLGQLDIRGTGRSMRAS